VQNADSAVSAESKRCDFPEKIARALNTAENSANPECTYFGSRSIDRTVLVLGPQRSTESQKTQSGPSEIATDFIEKAEAKY
jgi:hypothetical protein